MEKITFLIQLLLELFKKPFLKMLKRFGKYIKKNFIFWKNGKETISIATEMRCRVRALSGFIVAFFSLWISENYNVPSIYTCPPKIFFQISAMLLLIFSLYEFIKAIKIQEKSDKNS